MAADSSIRSCAFALFERAGADAPTAGGAEPGAGGDIGAGAERRLALAGAATLGRMGAAGAGGGNGCPPW